ncbi:MAG: tyrosine-type recombinase/integrase [Akkermansiaceae bacterium]
MATITKIAHADGTIHYKARIRHHGKQRSRTFTAQSDAKRWAKRVEVEQEKLNAGLISLGSNKIMHQAIGRYLLEVLPEKKSSTQGSYRQHLDFWDNQLGHLNLSDVKGETISRIRDDLRDGRAPATVNRYLATLGAVMTACVRRWHWMDASPMVQVEKFAENNLRRRFLSEDELSALLAACRDSTSPDLYTAVLLSISTGARQGEILDLRWDAIDLKRRMIVLRDTKTDDRTIPIVEQVVPLLRERKKSSKSDLVFPSRVTRKSPVQLKKPFSTALRRAGIQDFHWHDLRHSCASFLAADGASLLEIGEVLGHKSTQTTRRYSHLTEKHSHGLVRGLADKLLGGEK